MHFYKLFELKCVLAVCVHNHLNALELKNHLKVSLLKYEGLKPTYIILPKVLGHPF